MSGYEGRYQVNKYGEVLSIYQHHDRKRKKYHISKRYLKIQHGSSGHLFVVLHKDGKRKLCYIHILVAQAFLPNPRNVKSVYHKDGDITNNCVDNLEWCYLNEFRTPTECQIETARQLGHKTGGMYKKKICKLDSNNCVLAQYDSLVEACKINKLNIGHVSEVCSGKRTTAGGYYWKYI